MRGEPGSLACIAAGGLVVLVGAEPYRVAPEDIKALIFSGRPAPVTCKRVRRRDGVITGQMTIEGHAALNLAGRAVEIQTRAGRNLLRSVRGTKEFTFHGRYGLQVQKRLSKRVSRGWRGTHRSNSLMSTPTNDYQYTAHAVV